MFRLALMISLAACAAPHARTPAATPGKAAPPAPPRDKPLAEMMYGSYENPRPAVLEGIALAQPAKWGAFSPTMRTVGVMVFSRGHGPYNVTMGGDVGKLVGTAAILRVRGTWSPQMFDQMVATEPQIEVLPIDVPPILDAAQARWTAFVAEQEAQIAATLETASTRSTGRPLGIETVTSKDLFLPSWDPDNRTVTVTFLRVTTRQSSVTTAGRGCGKYEHGMGGGGGAPAPCAPSPDMYPRTHTRAYSAEAAVSVTLSTDGRVVAEHAYPLHAVPAVGPF